MKFGLGGYERRGALVVGEGFAESADEFRVPRPYSTPSSSRSGCPHGRTARRSSCATYRREWPLLSRRRTGHPGAARPIPTKISGPAVGPYATVAW